VRFVSGSAFRSGGLLVAVIGFTITRIFVSEAIGLSSSPSYLLAGVVPMLIGLGLTLYGVALAVGPFSNAFANTVARWCLAGTVGMLGVIGVTALEGFMGGPKAGAVLQSSKLVANVLLGGAVGGVLIGIRSAANQEQRQEIQRQVNRSRLFNRLLRHEVINAVTIIEGHADLFANQDEPGDDSIDAIQGAARRIGATVDEVGQLHDDPVGGETIDVVPIIREVFDDMRSAYPEIEFQFDPPSAATTAAADQRVEQIVQKLLENAALAAADHVVVELSLTPDQLHVEIIDDGPGLPPEQQQLLETGRFPEYDDPGAGFGLQIVRILVTRFGGFIDVSPGIGESGTAIDVVIPRNGGGAQLGRTISVTFPNLNRAVVAGLLAGAVMGLFFSAATDLLPVIGALYGVENPIVGWITHLFHSVVFAVMFTAGISHPKIASRVQGPIRHAAAGVAWGTVLWFLAAGLIMPLWLRFIGLPTSVPNLTDLGFTSHALWGIVLGVTMQLLGRLDHFRASA